MRIFFFDSIDEINSEIKMDSFIAQYVLELLTDACHPILAMEGEDHHKSAIEENPFHDEIITDQILEKFLRAFRSSSGEIRFQNIGCQFHFKLIFVIDCVDLIVHVEYLSLIEVERLNNVEKSMSMDGFFKGLTEQILSHFRVSDVFKNRENDIVSNQTFSCTKES